jgi:type II secretory pathway pseudopilin PulG
VNADGGMGLGVLILAFCAVIAIAWGLWGLARLFRKSKRERAERFALSVERNRLAQEQAEEEAYRVKGAAWLKEQQARDDLAARTFVQADPGNTGQATGSPAPTPVTSIGGKFEDYLGGTPPWPATPQDPGGAKARALLGREKLAKAKKRARKKK